MWLLAAMQFAVTATAQDSSGSDAARATDSDWEFRYDLFQMLLEENGLEIRNTWESAWEDPDSHVLVVVGSIESQDELSQRLSEFVLAGGSALIATDGPWSANRIGRIQAGPVESQQSGDQYKGFRDCLLLPLQDRVGDSLMDSNIVTNRSGWFEASSAGDWDWSYPFRLPARSTPRSSRGQAVLAIAKPKAALDSYTSSGILAIAADASLVSNGMLWHGDNHRLAIDLSRILSGPKKRYLTFIAEGRVLSSFSERLATGAGAPDQEPPKPETDLQKVLRLANAVVRDIEESNVLNEALSHQPRSASPARYLRALLVVFAALAVLTILWWLLVSGAARYPSMRPRSMLAAYEIRGRDSRGAGYDFRQPANYLAREFCFSLTGSHQSADWQSYLSQIAAENSLLWNAQEQKELRQIFDAASRGFQGRMGEKEFELIGRKLGRLRDKAAAG